MEILSGGSAGVQEVERGCGQLWQTLVLSPHQLTQHISCLNPHGHGKAEQVEDNQGGEGDQAAAGGDGGARRLGGDQLLRLGLVQC